MITISFCTWVRDWPDLKKTLPINLALTANERGVEFCVADIASSEPVAKWAEPLDVDRVRVQRCAMDELHFARAYNLAHRMGLGDVLVSLDGDNVIGPQYVQFLRKQFGDGKRKIVHAWGGDWSDGTAGRLAIRRDDFERLGGYDERLEACGAQDLDFRDRAQALGLQLVNSTEPAIVGLAIRTPDAMKEQHLKDSYAAMNARNAARSQQNIAAGRLIANK